MKKLFFLITLISYFNIYAQDTGSIKGLITEANGMPLSGATVYIKALDKGTVTDFDGNYILEDIAPGTYNVEVSYIGYETSTQSVSVTAGNTTVFNSSIKEGNTALNQVVITANTKNYRCTCHS